MPDTHAVTGMPYWRLSGFYLFYFATLGALIPYWGVYLKSLGFSAAEIGELMAIIVATKVVAPYVWGWVADHRGKRMGIIRFASLLAAAAFAGVLLGSGYWWLALVMSVFSFFWNAALPQFEVTTLNHLREQHHEYTRIRVWGSIGFIATVIALGHLLERGQMSALPVAVLALLIGIWAASLFVPEDASRHLPLAGGSFLQVLRRPDVLALLGACLFMQMSHGPYYTFYSIYLEEHGYGSTTVGRLWAIAVLAEVVLFMFTHRVLGRWGLRGPFLVSFLLAALRWLLIALFPEYVPVMLAAQLLHAASFGLYHAIAIQLIHRAFTGRLQGRGQALYSSISFGLGGALGSLFGGYAWDGIGPTVTYLGSSAAALVGLLLVWGWVDRGPRPGPRNAKGAAVAPSRSRM